MTYFLIVMTKNFLGDIKSSTFKTLTSDELLSLVSLVGSRILTYQGNSLRLVRHPTFEQIFAQVYKIENGETTGDVITRRIKG